MSESETPREAGDSDQPGVPPPRLPPAWRGPNPPRITLTMIVAMLALDYFLPGKALLVPPWTWAGVLPLLLGLTMVVGGKLLFDKRETTIRPFEESSMLVTGGMFALSRNPIYVGFLVLLTGVGVLLGSLTPFIAVPAMWLILDRRFIPVEEAMLEQTFGEEYLD